MSASREDVVRAIRDAQQEIEKVASALPEAAWSKQVHDQGWNAKQLLCHLAGDSGVAGFLINLANAPSRLGSESSFDIDAFNAREVAARQDKPVSDLLDERRVGCERSVALVQATPDDLLASPFRAPWGMRARSPTL